MAGRWKWVLPLLLGVAGAASASVFGSDDRLVVSHTRGSPFAPIGVAYDAATDRYGTAFLVDECHALTAEHLAGVELGNAEGARLEFMVGQRDNHDFESRTGATVVASGGFTERQWNRDADWLLLRLDQCLGREFGHVKLRPGQPPDRTLLHSAGYPSDKARIKGLLVIDPRCNVVGEAVRLWLHTCAGRAGDSGGPLFRFDQTAGGPEIEVYAIQAAAHPDYVSSEPSPRDFDPERPFIGLNEAVPIANILPHIRKYLQSP
jgi:V8-like Glu-specific endopeptidase